MEDTGMMDSVPVSAAAAAAAVAAGSKTGLQPQQGVPYDLESGFEPQARARSHTWPLPQRPEDFEGTVLPSVSAGNDIVEGIEAGGPASQHGQVGQGTGVLPVKKNSSRRNAWGNHSYAELITQAITSAPDERLTLAQIYDWMMQNIPYFREKGESNSSAGWKNSIRHNLSLHSRFMRVQNEGTGKSSWWMINHDAKPGKSSRRRATTMSDGKDEKRRTRIKRRIEALTNRLQSDSTSSPSNNNNNNNEGLDLFPDSPLQPGGFQLSPDFRPRASSNASSCGRLSPIPAIPSKQDWTPTYPSSYSPEQLAGNLAETMKLESYQIYQTSPPTHQQQTAPPSYYEAQYQRSNSFSTGSSSYALQPTPQSANQQRCPLHGLQPCACQMNLSPVAGMSPSYQQSEPSPTALGNGNQQTLQYIIQTQQCQQQQQQQTVSSGASPPQTPPSCDSTASTMMGQVIGALNSSPILDELDIKIDGGFGCTVEELKVIERDLLMGGPLDGGTLPDFFQQSVMGTAANQVSDGNIGQNGGVSQNNGLGTTPGNAPAGVYVSTNAATPAAPPSWVH